MSNPIKDNGKSLVTLLTDQKTADTYKNFFVLTWKILKETALFLWLLILFVIVAIGWVIDNVSNLSENYMAWRSTVDQKPEGNVATEVGSKLWDATKKSAVTALDSARSQLNITPPPAKVPKAVPASTTASTNKPPAPPTSTAPSVRPSASTTPVATPSAAVTTVATPSLSSEEASQTKGIADYKQEAAKTSDTPEA